MDHVSLSTEPTVTPERKTVSSEKESPRSFSPGQALYVLVVDDSLPAREYLRLKLEQFTNQLQHLEVETAESGEKAINLVGEKQFDLIFLDVEMDGMDGFSTCHSIRKADPGTRIAMLTSKSMGEDYQKGRNAGCDHYLTKPPVDQDLKSIVTLAGLKKKSSNRGQP